MVSPEENNSIIQENYLLVHAHPAARKYNYKVSTITQIVSKVKWYRRVLQIHTFYYTEETGKE
jgi:hypothetical protein